MRLLPMFAALGVISVSQPAVAASKTVAFYLDGARIEQEAPAVNGYLEYPLPDSFVSGSLRVKPTGWGAVSRVEVVSAGAGRQPSAEVARLEQQRAELQDRMQMLSSREEILRAAAKSQSGKAPRKSKSNPDPVTTLKQGTEFALAQLDAVYRSQRRCERELEAIDRKLAATRKGKPVVKVWLAGKKALISYVSSSERWTPSYDFRWSGNGKGELLLHARLPRREKGVQYLISNGTVAQGLPAKAVREDFPVLSRFPIRLTAADGKEVKDAEGERGVKTESDEKPPATFAFAGGQPDLPPGEGAVYWRGEYIGTGRFAGGQSSEFVVGSK